MKQMLKICPNQRTLSRVNSLLANGWELDPRFDSKPIRLENALVFPLVSYREGEDRLAVSENKKLGILEDVLDVVLVEPSEVTKWYANGYRVHEIYSKYVAMIKRV